jgi:hypothetical protein
MQGYCPGFVEQVAMARSDKQLVAFSIKIKHLGAWHPEIVRAAIRPGNSSNSDSTSS